MLLTAGSKVVYPSQGPCLIGPIVRRVIDGQPVSFYPLAFLNDRGVECLVPVDKLETSARPLLERSEIPTLLGHLTKPPEMARNWKQRDKDHTRLLASGSAFDLAKIVASLTLSNKTKPLVTRDSQMLDKARQLLACEISEVMGETMKSALERIDIALDGQKHGMTDPRADD